MARQKKKFQVFTLRLEELVLVEFQTCVYYLVSQICYNLIFLFLLLNLVEKKRKNERKLYANNVSARRKRKPTTTKKKQQREERLFKLKTKMKRSSKMLTTAAHRRGQLESKTENSLLRKRKQFVELV